MLPAHQTVEMIICHFKKCTFYMLYSHCGQCIRLPHTNIEKAQVNDREKQQTKVFRYRLLYDKIRYMLSAV
uniref:Uncharacterized protein n=1 Tax=Anguilla anguilla TaxID=7936 RepID=A0A0E9W8H7_ANGAN